MSKNGSTVTLYVLLFLAERGRRQKHVFSFLAQLHMLLAVANFKWLLYNGRCLKKA